MMNSKNVNVLQMILLFCHSAIMEAFATLVRSTHDCLQTIGHQIELDGQRNGK